MEETVIMFSGVLAGWFMLRLRGETQKQIVRWNGRIQTVCVACIIGIMGVNLGSMDGFAEKIAAMGGESLLFAVVPTALSAAAVWLCRGKISGKERS